MCVRARSFGTVILLGCAATGAQATDWYTGAQASGGDDWIVAVDASASVTSQGSTFVSATVTGAATGTLDQGGLRVRAEGLSGRFGHRGTDGVRARGATQEGAALVGYEWMWADAVLAGFVGVNVRNTDLSRFDPGSTAEGTTVGVKGVLEFFARPGERTMVQGYASYATAQGAYYGRLRAGYAAFGQTYIGPEVGVLGDDAFSQWRVGAHVTGLHVGPVRLGLSAGYASGDRKGGAYAAVDARAGF